MAIFLNVAALLITLLAFVLLLLVRRPLPRWGIVAGTLVSWVILYLASEMLGIAQWRQIMSLRIQIVTLAGIYFLFTERAQTARWAALGGALAAAATLFLLSDFQGIASAMMSNWVTFVLLSGIFALATLGLNLQWGYTGLFNIGVAGFFGLGAYVSAIVVQDPQNLAVGTGLEGFFGHYFNQPFLVGFLAAMGAAAVLAVVVGFATLRLRIDYLAIATIGIAEILRIFATNERTITEATRGIPNIPQPLFDCLVQRLAAKPPCQVPFFGWEIPQLLTPAQYSWFYVILVIGILTLGFLALERISRSPWGRALRAIREDEDAASSLGKNVFRFKMQSLIVGAVIMAAAGSLTVHFFRFVDPTIFDAVERTFLVWVMLIVGGTGNNRGALLGAFLMWLIWTAPQNLNDVLPPTLDTPWGKLNVAAQLFGPIRIIAIVVVLELILLYRPRGILGEEKITSTLVERPASASTRSS
jgi:branched-chain amino acid transport system permease protein